MGFWGGSAPSRPAQAVKVLRTAEFVPYVVFIEAPGPDTLRAMNRAALESGVATKQLTVGDTGTGGWGSWGEFEEVMGRGPGTLRRRWDGNPGETMGWGLGTLGR